MDRVDAVVVGAGVVGLAVARALARRGHETVVLEAEGCIGQGVSSRNSEVIHAGIYYGSGTLKARLCVQGRQQLYAYCAEHGLPHRNCGKLIVATDASQHATLQGVAERARAAGVELQPLTAAEACALEPALHCTRALWSATSGIVDSHALMLALQGELEGAGGALALKSALLGARFEPGRDAVLRVQAEAQEQELGAGIVINAAGLQACALARRFEGLDARHVPEGRFAKGNYFALAQRSPFSHLIYPVPVDAWLGVHLTLDLGGQARFGPDLEWLDVAAAEAIDYGVDPARAAVFERSIRHWWPGLPANALQPAYSGVRPKIHRPGEAAPDFRIDGAAVHGLAGLVNLFGIESPGLTAALALGEHVAERVEADLR